MSGQITLFHGTDNKKLDSIKKEGLRCSLLTGVHNFDKEKYVFFVENPQDAYHYAMVSASGINNWPNEEHHSYKRTPVLLIVSVSKKTYEKGRERAIERRTSTTLYMDNEILLKYVPPHRITIVDESKIKKVKKRIVELYKKDHEGYIKTFSQYLHYKQEKG